MKIALISCLFLSVFLIVMGIAVLFEPLPLLGRLVICMLPIGAGIAIADVTITELRNK